MTFLEITLENVGPFKGTHIIDLRVEAPRNVILIGALNGSGKTTLLNAFQLALYGRESMPGRTAKSYQQYLKQLINSHAALHDSASISLSLVIDELEGAIPVRIERRWWRSDRHEVLEKLTVFRGAEASEDLTANWDTFIAAVLPARVADLFFLDGEKIEALTEPDQASSILRKGMYTLLDLDRVEELRSNLRVVKRRRLQAVQAAELPDSVRGFQENLAENNAQRSELLQERASLTNLLDRVQARVVAAEQSFRESGGELYERRERWVRRQTDLLTASKHVSDQLRQMASRELPLLTCRSLLDAGIAAVKSRDAAERLSITVAAIRQRDQEYIRILKDLGLPPAIGKSIAAELSDTIPKIPSDTPITSFGVNGDRLERYGEPQLERIQTDAMTLLREADQHKSDLVEADQALEAVPSEDQISELAVDLTEANKELAQIQARLSGVAEHIERLDRKIDEAQRRIDAAMTARLKETLANAEVGRVVKHIELTDKSLEQYLVRMVQNYSADISLRVLESFKLIARKDNLLSGFDIDPRTFRMRLSGASGRAIEPGELSAGERQILAFAILDGLAKSAGRRIPTVIDSPLGRLDGVHRQKIAQHYLPRASHQTLIFSTDKEVDHQMVEELKESLAATYLLTFNERDYGTEISNGYFETR